MGPTSSVNSTHSVYHVANSPAQAEAMVKEYNSLFERNRALFPHAQNFPENLLNGIFEVLPPLTEKLNSTSPEELALTPNFFNTMKQLLNSWEQVVSKCERVLKETGTLDYSKQPLLADVEGETGLHYKLLADMQNVWDLFK